MTELHDALSKLAPLDYSDVPIDDLHEFLRSHFEAAELICNSIPPPPGGEDLSTYTPSHSSPNLATSAKDMIVSPARFPPPDPAQQELQKAWGKPYKFSSKENPLDVKVYKMAAHDKHGAWFSRRTVHEGISFEKMKSAMKREFLESLAVEGGPGAGAVRGIGVDKRLEHIKVSKSDELQVFQLSAQFPGPTTPREFVAMLLSSDQALTTKSTNGNYVPKHFIIVSRPVTHDDAPERSGYIRAKYESVELIREIPLHLLDKSASTSDLTDNHSHPSSRDRGNTISFAESRGKDAKGEQLDKNHGEHSPASHLNPFEWIMVTRSDPGGGIPRFMVERGTPSSVVQDVSKLLDWACARNDLEESDQEANTERLEQKGEIASHGTATESRENNNASETPATNGATEGYLNGAIRKFEAGLEVLAPAPIVEWLHPGQSEDKKNEDDDDESDTSSYESAPDDFVSAKRRSTESLPLSTAQDSTISSIEARSITGNKEIDKEIHKIEKSKKKLEEKAAKKREAEADKLSGSQDLSKEEQEKAKDRHDKEMKKAEEKHAKEVAKLDAKREKEIEKARKKAAKLADKDMVAKISRERDDFKRRLDLVQQENELLRSQIGETQRENTVLVGRLSKLGGNEGMLGLRQEVSDARKRAGSVRSGKSVSSSKLSESTSA